MSSLLDYSVRGDTIESIGVFNSERTGHALHIEQVITDKSRPDPNNCNCAVCIKDSKGCGIIEIMKTVENKALMRIYRKDLTEKT